MSVPCQPASEARGVRAPINGSRDRLPEHDFAVATSWVDLDFVMKTGWVNGVLDLIQTNCNLRDDDNSGRKWLHYAPLVAGMAQKGDWIPAVLQMLQVVFTPLPSNETLASRQRTPWKNTAPPKLN